jgi:FO synthase
VGELDAALARAAAGTPLSDEESLALAEAEVPAAALLAAAAAARDRAFGRVVTFSPKVFLPLTNLCRNRCSYCSFRRSPGDEGAWTMHPDEVDASLDRAGGQGCGEALFCLGDAPETAFPAYRRTLATFGRTSTVDYLDWAARRALERGILPHTNAGLLSTDDMAILRRVNVSLGLMLESVSARLCEPGMPHHRAPDKRPEKRLRMIEEAGQLRIPFTTGILVGIGETRRERVESLLAIRRLHRAHGHVQEVIVQNFRSARTMGPQAAPNPGSLHALTMGPQAAPNPGSLGALTMGPQAAPSPGSLREPDEPVVTDAVALARLILDADVSLQAPPNLNPSSIAALLGAGINDFGGISPVTPDYINPRHPWPHLEGLWAVCAAAGFVLRPRAPIYDRFVHPAWLDEGLHAATRAVQARLQAAERPDQLVASVGT